MLVLSGVCTALGGQRVRRNLKSVFGGLERTGGRIDGLLQTAPLRARNGHDAVNATQRLCVHTCQFTPRRR